MKTEAASGILLLMAAALALIMANSFASVFYNDIAHDLHLIVNDGLMTLFFFLIGLEIKREMTGGALSTKTQAMLPIIAAVGGMVAPALIFYFINRQHPENLNGWAIPSATDIAFALGILALLGKGIPAQLRILLLAIAVMDDLGAILIIALFYSGTLSLEMLAAAGAAVLCLYMLRRKKIEHPLAYIVISILLWLAVLNSGIHATIAGVVAAFFIPPDLGHKWEKALHPFIAFGIMPLFAFVNAGVPLQGADMTQPLPLGIILGLFLGKQLGIFGCIYVAVKSRFAKLPKGVSFRQIYGMSILCGIGFTMSLFIGMLAYQDMEQLTEMRLAVLCGSVISAVAGYLFLRFAALSK